MPKLEFPRVTRAIKLGEYAPEFGEARIEVHVNVPRATIDRGRDLTTMTDAELFAWLELLWGSADWPITEIEALWNHCRENDPALWAWLVMQTINHLIDYRSGVKKA